MSQVSRLDLLFLLSSLTVGGSERKIVRLANRLTGEGWKVGCAYLDKPDMLAAELNPAIPLWFLDRRGRFSLKCLRRFEGIVAASTPRAVFAVNLYPALYVAPLAKGIRKRGGKSICLVNTSSFVRGRDRLFLPLYRWALRRMDHVVYGSEMQRAAWVSQDSPEWSRSLVIHNGVDTEEFDAAMDMAAARAHREQRGIPASRFVIGSVGRLVPAKNQAVLLEVLSDLMRESVDAHLVLVGDGPSREPLEAQARQLGISDRVSFFGQLKDVRPALSIMDVFVLPSVAVETFSNAALEAMAMGKPVILSDIGGATEMVRDGNEGRIVALDSLRPRIREHLRALWESPAARHAMGNAARQRVANEFSSSAMSVRYTQLL